MPGLTRVAGQERGDFFRGDSFVKVVVHHTNRAGAAGGEALGEFDAELPIRADGDRVMVVRV